MPKRKRFILLRKGYLKHRYFCSNQIKAKCICRCFKIFLSSTRKSCRQPYIPERTYLFAISYRTFLSIILVFIILHILITITNLSNVKLLYFYLPIYIKYFVSNHYHHVFMKAKMSYIGTCFITETQCHQCFIVSS